MAEALETDQRPTEASGGWDDREVRIHFESRAALLNGFALAQKESWVEDCQVVLPRLELVIRMAEVSIHPRRTAVPRRGRRAATSIAAQAS